MAGCARQEPLLTGERESLRSVLSEGDPNQVAQAPGSAAIRLPAQVLNASWTHRIGSPKYRTSHPQLSSTPSLAWSADIGAGDSRKNRITADPVAADGRIFTLDAEAQVTATSVQGETLWQADLTPLRDKAGEGTGGGLAYADNIIYVASGFGLLTAFDAATGDLIWEQKLGATGSGAPTVYGNLIYIVSGDDTAWALDTKTGRIRWQLGATEDVSNVLGGAAPAVNDKFVVFPYGDGGLHGAFRKGGLRLWSSFVSGARRFDTISTVTDITGDPVIVGDTVYVGSHSGRLVAMDVNTGKRNWTVGEGALSPVWPIAGALFVLSDRNELVRLNAEDGSRVWGVDLPNFKKFKQRKANEVFAHYGPIVAGGQVILASNDGVLRFFDPVDGTLIRTVEVPGGATTAPIVANGTLYVVGAKGQLHAFR
ncbi:MAG: PQQ-binding-like beta-propeller repeat protein [Thalassovita sp.]